MDKPGLQTAVVSLLFFMQLACVGEPSPQASPAWNFSDDFPAEKRVFTALTDLPAGQAIDLSSNVVGGNCLRAEFLGYVLTCGVVRGERFRLVHAEVVNDLILPNLDVPFRTALISCQFDGAVVLRGAHFHGDLSLAQSVFNQPLSLHQAVIDGDLLATNTVFLQSADFTHCAIGGDLLADCAWFGGPAKFEGVNVGHSAHFDPGCPAAPLFTLTNPPDAAHLDDLAAEFATHGCPLSASNIFLSYSDPAQGQWRLLDFCQRKAWAFWGTNPIAVRPTAYFGGQFDADGALIKYKFTAADVAFAGDVILDSLQVSDSLCLDYAHIAGQASLGFANVADQFSAEFTRFGGPARFYNLHCSEAVLQYANFAAGGDFSAANVAGQFDASYACFSTNVSQFFGLNVQGSAYFDRAVFAGPVTFILAHIGGNLDASGAHFQDNTDPAAIWSRTANHHPFNFNADFGSLKVDGFAFFYHAVFSNTVSFQNASFQSLYLDSVAFTPGGPNAPAYALRLEGMSFRRIRSITNDTFTPDQRELDQSWRHLKRTLRALTPYTFEVYDNLEGYFRQEGQPGIADDVHIEGKEREREGLTGLSWLASCVLDYSVGYGRRPILAAFWSLGIISMGCLGLGLFMERTKDAPKSRWHPKISRWADSFFHSVDVFVPLIDLKVSENWEPKQGHYWILWCRYLLGLLGCIFVPVWAAALAGLIK